MIDENVDREKLITQLCEMMACDRETLLGTPKQTVVDGLSAAIGSLQQKIRQSILDAVGPTRVWHGTKEELVAAAKKHSPIDLEQSIAFLRAARLATMELL